MRQALKHSREESVPASGLMECIVALSVLQMFLAATIPALKIFQVPVELLLAGLLAYKICTVRLLTEQVVLIAVFVFVTLCSFFTQDQDTFLVNAKQNGIGVLSLICFSQINFKSRLIFPVFAATGIMILVNRVFPELMLPFISLTFDVQYNLSTFGGIFLNSHFNAFFLAIALIYYGRQRFLYGGGLLLVYIAASRFIFVSYIANLVCSWLFPRYGVPGRRFSLYAILTGLVAVLGAGLVWSDELTEILISWNASIGETQNSLVVIVLQLVDPAYYSALLNPIPSGVIDVSGAAKLLYLKHDGHNEIGIFSLATQSGIFLGGLYLALLLKNAPLYVAFILVSLLHNNFIMSPLCVYMLVTYSRFNALRHGPGSKAQVLHAPVNHAQTQATDVR
ncbi:hypothetical protein [Polaromonas sp. A23]|uniref:hypothetical protein n=1 Tax=Polaromonas sp. A23 TaxID=1944133 RepID=UPI000984A856|nr:hypothetical protein [Polaromonas sp. A23]OOG44672.1 hypothetical protein B0B52_06040 [Polaromonas sp. A23]